MNLIEITSRGSELPREARGSAAIMRLVCRKKKRQRCDKELRAQGLKHVRLMDSIRCIMHSDSVRNYDDGLLSPEDSNSWKTLLNSADIVNYEILL